MKKYLILGLFTSIFSITITLAEDIKPAENNTVEMKTEISEVNARQSWNVKADTWIIEESRWYEYRQLITISLTDGQLYMWSIGGAKTPVYKSDKRGYDYMVNSPRGKWRFYFNQSDLR